MPTNANRPFLSNFLAAFRAQSAFQSAAPSPPPSSKPASQSVQQAAYSTSTSSATPPYDAARTAKPSTANPAAHSSTAAQSQTPFSPSRSNPTAMPYAKSPGSPGGPASPSSPPQPTSTAGYPIPSASSRHRRGSDSSSDGGFRERTGSAGNGAGSAMPEKWYIGGRTPGGEERFYKLGMVRRMRSSDRLSLDRLSL